MNTKKLEIIRKAKRYQRRNFLTATFRRYYLEYCAISQIPALDFLALVKGTEPNSNVINITDASYKKIKPVISITDYLKFYESEIIDKRRLTA